MSTQNRTGGGGRNQKKSNVSSAGGGGGGGGSSSGGGGGDTSLNNKKTDALKPEKEKTQPKPTAEQIRIAQITDISSGTEDPEMREKVQTLIEMTQRSEEEVCCALNECDNNLEKAVAFLFETLPVGAFETSSKKKKNRATNSTNEGSGDGEWTDNNANVDNRERSRNRNGIRGGRGGSDSRGWRSREARENERNAADSKGGEGGGWRGRGRGGSRGGYGGRGGRGGRMGPRGMGSRDQGRNNYSRQEPQEVDTWDNTIATNAEQAKQDDEWGDWDNEEYVGSLKDTKVFVPSNLQSQSIQGSEMPVMPGLETHNILNQPTQMTADDLVQQYTSTVVSNTTSASPAVANSVQYPDMHPNNTNHNLRLTMESQQLSASATLSAEQSQYFNSLPSQNAAPPPNYNTYQTSSPSYVSNAVFGDQVVSSQPAVRRARAKVPPPSKIPSSAVEMPGDALNNIGYLDVQFGGLDFGTEDSFDRLTEKFNATNIDSQQNVQAQDVSNDYQSKSNVQQSSLAAGLQSSQIISNSDSLSSSQTDNLTSGYSQRGVSSANAQQTGSNVGVAINNSVNNTLDQLSKNDPYNQSNATNTNVYQSSYSSNATTNKTPSYQTSGAGQQGYNNSNYTNSQTASSTYQPSTNSYATYNQNSVNSYQTQNQTSAVNNAGNSVSGVSGGAVSNSGSTQNIPVGAGGANSTVNSASSNTNAGYLSSQYQSNQTTSAFPSQQNTYQNSQSVYGNTGFTGSTNTSSSQYSNFSSSKLKETSTAASAHFDSVSNVTSSTTVSSTVSSTSSSSVSTNNLSSPSLGLTNTKVTTSTAKSSAGIVPNVQMVSQFIQTGLPYFQQPAVYSYEDIQMMQQRMPHVTQYYDLNYPPTSLGASGVRDANLSVAYSTMTDGRFARTDNNSSPVSNVSSTLSQQAGSSGAMLNVPYAYFYNTNMMPGSFQYGTPAIYPQQMPTANATSGGQFAKPSYNSGYGSTSYDALSQATKDYNKGYIEYPASGVQQSKAQNVTNPPQASSGSDITSSMYGKSHVALNKVNSYEKQSFHSGTPPPFNLTGTQTAGATSAQPYGVYIQPMPPAHHTMNLHQPIHQMDGRMHNSTRRDSNSAGQRPQPNSQSKTGTKQNYSPSYWTAQN